MNWIERYVNAVTQRLPKAKRDDIGVELESILRDKVEEQEASLGRPLDEAEVLAELKTYGHPLQVAARYQDQRMLERELNRIIDDAVSKKIALVEIIPGKGSGQLKKKVLRFLDQPHIKKLYHRIEKDSKNFGRVFVHFRFNND